MSLLRLSEIGKIYVSEGNVSVGIRGVDLSFDKGEFVAVTGKSGSGKSTLLNVISGMDTYEEGELYIEGEPTSHYLQPDWESYREKYISFIFQDYNIIESFTVLQNVELALMHISDKKERRKRAVELIDRVGLSSHIKHKGSRLSGGQKQRTVIARALAKDSPIILADEPTGNLDSATSKEIIDLLKEVSKDKLLIMVTHNFDQVAEVATRHIRIFDGAIESDHVITAPEKYDADKTGSVGIAVRRDVGHYFKNGVTLGRTVFTAKPKLSIFLCLLMCLGIVATFAVTAFCTDFGDLMDMYKMFEYREGRVVLTNQNGSPLTESQLEEICQKHGAESYLHYDALMDASDVYAIELFDGNRYVNINMSYSYTDNYGDDIVGRYPENENEVFLYLPIYYSDVFGTKQVEMNYVELFGVQYEVSGVKYFYDNTKDAKCLLTEKGFEQLTACYYLWQLWDFNCYISVSDKDGNELKTFPIYSLVPSQYIEDGKLFVMSSEYNSFMARQNGKELDVSVSFSATYAKQNYFYSDSAQTVVHEKRMGKEYLTDEYPRAIVDAGGYVYEETAYISKSLWTEICNEMMENSYAQASLFFENDKKAAAAAEALRDEGYIAVTSDTTYEPPAFETIVVVIACLFMGFLWFVCIIFLAFFINLCSSRSMLAFKSDMAIMRSMGIKVGVIRVAMFVRMLLSLIPAFISLAVAATLIYLSPTANAYFMFLHPWQYALIILGMLILTFRITVKQVKKLFGESVKKSLKRGDAE